MTTPAMAQVGVVASVFSDDRFRGYSLSGGRPVAILDLSYDSPDGIYAAASASAAVGGAEGLEPLGLQLNAGYAKRLGTRLTLDVGAIHSSYSRYSNFGGSSEYSEIYAGIAGRDLSTRLSFSPSYFKGGPTFHGEVNGHFGLSPHLNLVGDVGLLVPLGHNYRSHPIYDARLGLDRSFGRVSLHAAVTSRGSGGLVYRGRSSRNALVVGASYRF